MMRATTATLLRDELNRRRCRSSLLMSVLVVVVYLMLSYHPHPIINQASLRSTSTVQHKNLLGLRTLPPIEIPNHSHQFVLVIGSTASGSKLVTSLCALCLGLTATIRHGHHGGYGDQLLKGRSDVVLHRSIPHGYGTPITDATTLDMLIGRDGEMFIDPIKLEDLAIQRNYNTTKFVLVVRDKSASIVSSVANRHARGFSDAREHMNRTSFILKSLMKRNNTLVVDYESLVQYWEPLWKPRFATFLQCPESRFKNVNTLADGNQKYVFSMKAYLNEVLFRLRIL